MNHEDFNEEVRRERIESDAAARTLGDEIEDRENDIRELHESLADCVQRLARATEALTSHRVRLRDANARNEAQQTVVATARDLIRQQWDEIKTLRLEHKAGVKMRAVPDIHSPEFIDAYRPWADAHDRTELAK